MSQPRPPLPDPDPRPPPVRLPALDLLRVVAVSMTVLVHAPSVVQRFFFLRPFDPGLWLGVDLFMLISGWLLGGQLLREAAAGPIDVPRFYVKRWLRTLPPYYAMLALLAGLGSGAWSELRDPGILLAHATFVQVYAGVSRYLVSWSLCVEEHFYLLLPWVIGWAGRRGRGRALLVLIVGLELVAIASRWHDYPLAAELNPFHSHLRSHGLFVGLGFAYVQQHRADLWERMGRWVDWAVLLGLAATLVVMATQASGKDAWVFIGAPTLGTWTLAPLLLGAVHERSRLSRFDLPGLRAAGELTYAIYLTHDVIPYPWLHPSFAAGGLASVAWRLVMVVGTALLLHHLVEKPALHLRTVLLRRWTTRRPAPAPQA